MSSDPSLNAGAMPLAARMRPREISQVVGQHAHLAAGTPLHQLAQPAKSERKALASVILFGPPGTGKTTIAQAISNSSGRKFVELSAVTAGVKDVRDVIERARSDFEIYGRQTILFLDEIHRFSKSQQDSLLPAVEHGLITLIAATTENPAFSVISPLLSRSLLVELSALDENDISDLIKRALVAPQGLADSVTISDSAIEMITRYAGGDARKALTILEAAAQAAIETAQSDARAEISTNIIELATDRVFVAYDKSGDQHYDVISAFIKSIRGSDADAAIHYLARMLDAGEDPRFIARRLIILASEDVGLADLHATTVAVDAFNAVNLVGMPEGRIPLANATIYLSLAPKSNAAYNAINAALDDIKTAKLGVIPKALRSSNYSGAKSRGNGVGYRYPHDDPRGVLEQQYLSRELGARRYYEPKPIGTERELGQRWQRLREIIRDFKK